MSFFPKGKKVDVVLFSPLAGTLTYQGKPASGAELALWIAWKDKKGETQSFTADEQGAFSIPIQKMTYHDNPLVQLVINQTVTVKYGGDVFLIWDFSKTDGTIFSELVGKPEGVRCELTDEEVVIRGSRSLGATICKWDRLTERKY